MKKFVAITLLALTVATSASALSLPKADMNADKVKLNKCLMEEGQRQLLAGNLTKETVKPVAKDVAATCTTKLALKGNDAETVQLATDILQGLLK